MERRSFSSKSVLIGLFVSLVIGFFGGLYVFQRFTTFTPSALCRIPEDAVRVTRLSLQQGVLYEPFVRYLLPLIERNRHGPEPRIKHIERKTSLELNVDVREFVAADLPEGRWLWVAAGFLREEKALSGVARLAQEEGFALARDGDALVHPSGIAFAVAADGTLLMASDRDVALRAARRDAAPSWSLGMDAQDVAVAVHVRGPVNTTGSASTSHLLEGTLLVKAETYFPTDASFLLEGENWTSEQTDSLLASRAGDFSYLLPLEFLQTQAVGEGRLAARGNLGRPRFDEAIARLAQDLEARLPQNSVK